MNIIKKSLSLTKEEYFKKHLLIINHLLPVQMTPKEAEVLAAFMSLEGDLARDPFGTTGRKQVREKVKISAGGLGNYLDQLKSKGFIVANDSRGFNILPFLIPAKEVQGYQFKIKVNGGE